MTSNQMVMEREAATAEAFAAYFRELTEGIDLGSADDLFGDLPETGEMIPEGEWE